MSFHRASAYAVNFGLDPDNVLRIGGWSAPANRWQLDMSGNQTIAGNLNATGGYVLSVNHLSVAGNGNGYCFWQDCTNYKISMGNAVENKYGPVTDYSVKNTMSNTAGRGWTWGTPGAVPIAAISTAGDMRIAGNLTVSTNIVSPNLSGAPTAATPVDGDDSNRVATTAWVKANVNAAVSVTVGTKVSKKVFATAGTWNGNLGGLAGADAKCQTEATSAGLSGTYRAILSSTAFHARRRTNYNWDMLTLVNGDPVTTFFA